MRICWAQYALWVVIAVLGMGSILSGCGAKGPLYLPKKAEQPAASQPAPRVSPATPQTLPQNQNQNQEQ